MESDCAPGIPERILPDGCAELIFHFGDKFQRLSGDSHTDQPDMLLVGQLKKAIVLQATGKTGILGIRFYPWGLYPFTGAPADEFTDRHIASEDHFKSISHLADNLYGNSQGDMLRHAEGFLLGLLKQRKQKYFNEADRFAALLPEMMKDTTGLSVGNAAAMANMSVRQFNRKFGEVIGLSPKHFIRIARMQQFIHSYRMADTESSLSSLIYDCGYYDPAHFSRDFKDIAGVNPSEYFEDLQDFGKAMLL